MVLTVGKGTNYIKIWSRLKRREWLLLLEENLITSETLSYSPFTLSLTKAKEASPCCCLPCGVMLADGSPEPQTGSNVSPRLIRSEGNRLCQHLQYVACFAAAKLTQPFALISVTGVK